MRLAVLVVALAMGGTALGTAPGPEGDETLDCQGFAPVDNDCEDCCADFDEEYRLDLNLLPYVGRLYVKLNDTDSSRAIVWRCDVLGADRVPVLDLPLTTCTPTVVNGGPRSSDSVRLICFAQVLPATGTPPAGPFSCQVTLFED